MARRNEQVGDRRRPRRSLPARRWGLLAAFAAAALIAACTSEERNEAGTGLVDVRFDALAETLTATVVTDFGEVAVREAAIPFPNLQLVYVGRQGTIRSQLLARYDFQKFVQRADSAGAAITVENIRDVDLLIYAVNYYRNFREPDSTVVTKRYLVRELAEPLDPALYPGPPPALAEEVLSATISAPTAPTLLPLPATSIVEWAADPASFLGLSVAEDETQSDPGLIGFAAVGFPFPGTQLPQQPEGTLLGPVLRIEFNEPQGTFINLLPEEDVSTLSGLWVPEAADQAFLVQTHLRRYPRFWFDFSALPPNVLVNYAGLMLTADTTLSFGPSLDLVLAEVDSAAVAGNEIELTVLDDRVRIVTGRFGVEPESTPQVELDVTSTVQRLVNGAIAAPVQFMLLAGDDFTGFDSGILDPEYTLSQLFFRGTAAPDPAERPRLRLVYTAIRQIRDGGAR